MKTQSRAAPSPRRPRHNPTRLLPSPIQRCKPPCGTSPTCGRILKTLMSSQTNRQPMINDLTEAAQGTKPSPASVSTLADDLAPVVAGNKQLHAQHQKLAQNVHAIFNSSHLSPRSSRWFWTASKNFNGQRRVVGRRDKCDQRPQNDCSRNQIKPVGRSNARRAKNPATGLPENSGRFVRSAASWLTSANGSAANTSSPNRCARSILKNSPTCRPASIWTSRRRIDGKIEGAT